MKLAPEQLREKLDGYVWYHAIEVEPGVVTVPVSAFNEPWELIEYGIGHIIFEGKTVLDVGARDGRWSFAAEKSGARSVTAIDNDLSPGGLFLKDYFESQVDFREVNLYEVPVPEGGYDIVMLLGTLYHLRYPFQGLQKCVDLLAPGGTLAIETALLCAPEYSDLPLLYCPSKDSPYDVTSCSFFNRLGLESTLESMGMATEEFSFNPNEAGAKRVRRAWLRCTKSGSMTPMLEKYWRKTHRLHETLYA